MALSAVPLAMVAALAVAWALPFAWWAAISSAAFVTVAMVVVVVRARSVNSPTVVCESTMHAAVCVWAINAIAIAYAVGSLGSGGEQFTRLGYAFLVKTGLALPGGALLLILMILVSLVPVVLRSRSG
jgi:hypothetical protein